MSGDGRKEVQTVLDELAEHFDLDPGRIGRLEVFAAAIERALTGLSPVAVIDEVVSAGSMRGAREPWGVLLARLRRIPAAAAARTLRETECTLAAESNRQAAGSILRERLDTLVATGTLSPAEAADELVRRGYAPTPVREEVAR